MSSTFSYDVLYTICQQAYHVADRQDLAALCLVSKQAKRAATPFLYRSVVFNLAFHGDASTKNLIDVLTRLKPDYRYLVRDVTVARALMRNESKSRSTTSWFYNAKGLTKLLPLLSNIQHFQWVVPDFTWKYLLEAIVRQQSITEIAILNPSFLPNWKLDGHHGKFFISASHTLSTPADLKITPFRFRSLKLSFEGSGHFELLANRPSCKDTISTHTSTFDDLILEACDFLPGHSFLQQQINISELLALELTNCTNLGFLFNNLLCEYKILNLKRLLIKHDAYSYYSGEYFGREKLERFLMLHEGLEEITFANLEANRPSVQAISAQGATLQRLTLHESQILPPRLRSPLSADDIQLLADRCRSLRHLSIDLAAKTMSPWAPTATILRQFESVTHLEILHPSEDLSTVLDRSCILHIFSILASPGLKRLDVYSAGSSNGYDALQHTLDPNLQRHWRVNRMGRNLTVVDLTPPANKAKRFRTSFS